MYYSESLFNQIDTMRPLLATHFDSALKYTFKKSRYLLQTFHSPRLPAFLFDRFASPPSTLYKLVADNGEYYSSKIWLRILQIFGIK